MSGVASTTGSVRKAPTAAQHENRAAYLFLAPWIFGFLVFIAYPLLASIYYSLTDWDLLTPPKWIWLENFRRMVGDRLFWRSLRVTASYAAMRVPAGIVFGLGLALILNSRAIRLKSAIRLLYYLPAVLPPVAVSLMWTWIFAQDGILNNALTVFGVKSLLWINDERLVLPSFLMMAIWSLMGKNMLIYLAGLNSIPVQLVESASIDGATGWKTFWRIKLPLLTPILFYEIVMTLIESFKIFTQAYVMTRGGPRNASLFYVYYLYKNAFEYFQMGYASALAWVLFVLVMALTLIVFRSSNRWVHYEGGR
ncbi:MAG: sugar ABC transporter permease [Spirochaetes bacterium]|nr:sugar ABC transporter permease [Spirochaetota bacterium]